MFLKISDFCLVKVVTMWFLLEFRTTLALRSIQLHFFVRYFKSIVFETHLFANETDGRQWFPHYFENIRCHVMTII